MLCIHRQKLLSILFIIVLFALSCQKAVEKPFNEVQADPVVLKAEMPAKPVENPATVQGNTTGTGEPVPAKSEPQPALEEQTLAKDQRRWVEDEKNTIDIFEAAAPATVFVTQSQIVRDWRSASALEVPAGTGTGFIWDKLGHIVTNYHIVAGGSSWRVTLYNQKNYDASFVGGDPKKDIAVLKINAPASELETIVLPPESNSLSVGQKAIAIGNPFGLDHTLTTGIISAIGRDLRGYGGVIIKEMIQTDASINPGNSGGPLLDSTGALIGMNTMILSKTGASAGIGFAVPVSTIRRIVPQIIATGRAEQIGLGVLTIADSIARRYGIRGVIVQAVMEGSPAAQAGLQGVVSGNRGYYIGDIIVGIDNTVVHNTDELYSAIDGHSAGDRVDVKILRDGKPMTLSIELYVLND